MKDSPTADAKEPATAKLTPKAADKLADSAGMVARAMLTCGLQKEPLASVRGELTGSATLARATRQRALYLR